jgi:hypothetical protein
VHVIVWVIQHNHVAYYATPDSVQRARNSYPHFFSFVFVLGRTAHTGKILADIPRWWMLFMVCFVLPLVVPPASSHQYIGAVYFVGCIIQFKISVHYAHTHPVQKSLGLIASCFLYLAGTPV